ncbi:MAG: hypothetical protein EAZ89_21995, partial [Bacteroidetes bacterium]
MNTLTRQSFFSTLLVALLLSTSLQAQSPQNQANRPNIIYILADDLGYADLICYRQPGGGQALVKTPNLDRMAAQGTRFTRFYAGSTVCAPSRAALMTGMHAGHGYIRGNGEIPLRKQDTTLVQRLKAIGYRTGMFGKWGLGVNGTDGTPKMVAVVSCNSNACVRGPSTTVAPMGKSGGTPNDQPRPSVNVSMITAADDEAKPAWPSAALATASLTSSRCHPRVRNEEDGTDC